LGSSLASAMGQQGTAQENFRRAEIAQQNAQTAAIQGFGSWSAVDYRNGSDIQSDNYVADRARADALYGLGNNGPVRLGKPSGMGVAEWSGGVNRAISRSAAEQSAIEQRLADLAPPSYGSQPGVLVADASGKLPFAPGLSTQAIDAATQRLASAKLTGYANDWASKAVSEFNNGNTERGKIYLGYANSYYKASGDALESSKVLDAVAPKFQLPEPALGNSQGDRRFEFKFGAAAYAIGGGNIEFTADINISRPFQSSFTEFEAGIGLGVGFKAKVGLEGLKGSELTAAIPTPYFNPLGQGQASNTGAVSTKVAFEGAIPFLTVTGLEFRGGLQSPLTGMPVTKENYGGIYEFKYLEPKLSPALNVGLTAKWDIFNTSYKRSSTGGQR